MTAPLKLWPVIGINLYQIPIPEMVEQLKQAQNDDSYPESVYKALMKQRGGSIPIRGKSEQRPRLIVSDGLDDLPSQSDTSSSSKVVPIRHR